MNPFAQIAPQAPQTVFAQFFHEPVHMKHQSEQEGRPIFEDREFVRILVAGDAKSAVVREATDLDKTRFAPAYAAFQKEGADRLHVEGTPLSEWAQLRASQVRELNAVNIFTVEQLAGLSDAGKERLGMGAHELVTKAKAYLAGAASGAEAAKYAVENERMKEEITDLRQQIRDLGNVIEGMRTSQSSPAPTPSAPARNSRAA